MLLLGGNSKENRCAIISNMILLVGNWKMAPEKSAEALTLAKKVLFTARKYKKSLTIVECVPAIHIPFLAKNIKTGISIGGQGVAPSDEVAQTGLASAGMLASYGAKYCIVGHSESRARGETDEQTFLSTQNLLQKKVTPIICVGEKERDSHGWYLSEVKSQIESIVSKISQSDLKKIVFVYEPVWAIGKDAAREATVAECREMIIFIRKVISDATNEKVGSSVHILYGGSVDDQNAHAFITDGGAQGLLVGRVSLDAKRFEKLVKNINLVA